MILHILSWLAAAICFLSAYLVLTRPEIDRKAVIRNYIQVLVDSEKLMTGSDKITLLKKRLDDIDLSDVPKWQQDAFVRAVLIKFRTL